MKLESLPTALTTKQLDVLLSQLAKLGATVKADSLIIRTATTPKGVKVLSAARSTASGPWHVMAAPGLVTAKRYAIAD